MEKSKRISRQTSLLWYNLRAQCKNTTDFIVVIKDKAADIIDFFNVIGNKSCEKAKTANALFVLWPFSSYFFLTF